MLPIARRRCALIVHWLTEIRPLLSFMATALALQGCLFELTLTARERSQWDSRRQTSKAPPCWTGDDPINRNLKGRRFEMDPKMAKLPVDRTTIAVRLCIKENGSVDRAIVLISTGNPVVDESFQSQAVKWKLQPVQKEGKNVKSYADFAQHWQY